jgi:hypothetical protein
LARHRIGEELKLTPVNKGGPVRRAQSDAPPPTMAEQVGSQDRGHRLKKLAEVTKAALRRDCAALPSGFISMLRHPRPGIPQATLGSPLTRNG